MENKPLISIIVPVYNYFPCFIETLNSVKKQTYTNWEIIFVDDCSTDESGKKLDEILVKDRRINVVHLSENSGAAIARNKGLDLVKGDFVAFLDADDEWYPEKLEKQLSFMLENNYYFSFTAYEIITSSGELTNKLVDHISTISVGYKDMLKKRATMGCSTVMLDWRELCQYRMPLIRTGQDYGLWLNILRDGYKAHCLNEVLTKYRIVPGSISRNKIKKAIRQWKIYREIEGIPFFESFWYFLNYAYRAVTR